MQNIWKNLLDDRNEIIKQIEAKNEDTTEIEMSYPENAFEGFVGKKSQSEGSQVYGL